MFITGGEFNSVLTSSELVDLSGNGITCSPPADLPYGDDGMSSLKTLSGNPLVCGGRYDDTDCLEFSPAGNEWLEGPQLLFERQFSPAIELTNGSYWVLSASTASPSGFNNSEISTADGFVLGPDVPTNTYSRFPCAVKISEDEVFFANDVSYIFDKRTGLFEETEYQLEFEVDEAQCGLATKSDGSRMVVISGGFITGYYDSVQIYDLETGLWRFSTSLPSDLRLGQVIPFGNTFLIFGGRQGSDSTYSTDEILEFQPDTETWIVREERMSTPRSGFYAVYVNKSGYDCQ